MKKMELKCYFFFKKKNKVIFVFKFFCDFKTYLF